MLQALVSTASRLLGDLNRSWFRRPLPPVEDPAPAPARRDCQRLQRLVLTDQVCRTLFDEYAAHRRSKRGDEETGWVLLGLREADEAVVLAALPAGTARDAGFAHVLFSANAQAVGARILMKTDRRIRMIGVLHTHPGSLRHPSAGDFEGDSQWVGQFASKDGIFGIGTADAETVPGTLIATQPRPHVQCLGELCLSWYTLAEGDKKYRPLPVHMTLGPDLARPLSAIWQTIEHHAEPLERLCRQQARANLNVANSELVLQIPLAPPYSKLGLFLKNETARYVLVRDDDLIEVNPGTKQVDQGVYLVLAELATQK